MLRKKAFWIGLIGLALLVGGGYAAYANGLLPWFDAQQAAVETPTLQTARVSAGSLSITADGSGTLVPSTELNLAFGSSGTLMELLVKVGDKVKKGDVLGWIDDTDALNANGRDGRSTARRRAGTRPEPQRDGRRSTTRRRRAHSRRQFLAPTADRFIDRACSSINDSEE